MNSISIYNNHLEAFQAKKFDIFTETPKVLNSAELKAKLETGEIMPKFFFAVLENTLSVSQQMFFHTILKFSSDRMEVKFKALFLQTLAKIGINQ